MRMSAVVVPFYFESHQVRTLVIDSSPWFVAKDVCEFFGDTNYRRSVNRLDEDEKGVSQIDTPGGLQQMTTINESGLYSLLFWMQPDKATGKLTQEEIESRKALLKKFRKWVTAEVLPSIRKTGTYSLPTRPVHIPLFPGKEYAAALAHTREGELLARELTVGIRISQACGMRGRRQILEEGNALAAKRCGIDPLQYFDVSLEKLFPRAAADEGPGQLIASFIADEYTLPEQLPGALEYHVPIPKPRLPLKAVYERFKLWWAERIDNRLRYLPSMKHMAKMLRENGIEVKPSGGKTWAIGLEVRA